VIQKFRDFTPDISPEAYVHETSVIIGNVKIAANASVWPLAAIRADVDAIEIGENTNVQDCCVIHVNENAPCIIGRDVTIGHGAVVHGARVGNRCLVGMNAVVLESEIGDDCLIAAGSVLTGGKQIPPRSLVMGVPAKVVRELSAEELKGIASGNSAYLLLSDIFKNECAVVA